MKSLNTHFKARNIFTAIMLMALAAFSANSIQAQTYVGGSATVGTVAAPFSPYPLTVDVDVTGSIASISLSVTMTHTFPDDIDLLLVSPTGAKSIVMSDAGGGTDIVGVTLVFEQSAAAALPDVAIVAGTYKPVDYTTGDVFPVGPPVGPYTANFDNFVGSDPFGTWSLYASDDAGGDAGSIDAWSLTIVLASPCTDPPTAGATLLSSSTICSGNSVTASLSGGTIGDGQTYQWQSSPDGVSYSDILGATSNSHSESPASTTYYQCVVTCGAGSDISTPAMVSVNPTPDGNTSATAIEVTSLPFVADGDNLTANCWTNTIGATAPDVWYVYTADCDGTIDIDLCTETWDSYLRIYDASLVNIGGDDDTEPLGCYTFSSSVDDFAVTSGTTYYIVVDAFSTGEGTYTLSINPLNITPAGTTVCYGEVVTLSATDGYDTYQWYKNGKIMAGQTASSLETIKPGYYQVTATSGDCEFSSDVQAVAVLEDFNVYIRAVGGNTDLCSGVVKLKNTVDGFYSGLQWYKDGLEIPGATGNVYYPSEAGEYYCIATTLAGCADMSYTITVTSSCRLGEEISMGELNLYPNPAKGEVFISATFNNTSDANADVSLYNSLGQLVYSSTVILNNGFVNESISLANMAAGVYTAVIRSESETFTSQLVINK